MRLERYFIVLAALCHVATASSPRHIAWIVVDDLGWGDLGYKGVMYAPDNATRALYPPTPNIDNLAMSGVRLESLYVHPLCSPSRTAFLSGRYAYTTGMNSEVIVNGVPDQLPTNIRTVADLLSDNGWATAAFGKWDAGMTTWGCTPTCRGFDTYTGFYNAYESSVFSHTASSSGFTGHDLVTDFSQNTAVNGEYITPVLTDAALTFLNTTLGRNASSPTFMYFAHQALHAPQQVPASYLPRCAAIPADQPIRRMACAQMTAVDDSVGQLVAAYSALGIIDETLFLFVADNGPNTDTGGSAYPLRGMKATTYEGGIRAAAFAWGAGLAPSVRGSVNQEFYSLVDLLPSIVHGIGGIDLSEAGLPKHANQPAPPPLDGMDVWASISQGLPSPRTQALLQLDPVACYNNAAVPCTIPGQGAVRVGRYKLIKGHVSVYAGPGNVSSGFCGPRDGVVQPNTFPLTATPATTPPFCPTGWVPSPGSTAPIVPAPEVAAQCTQLPCTFYNSTLLSGIIQVFDVVEDMLEQHDLAPTRPDLVAQLLAVLDSYNATGIPQAHSPADPLSNPARFGGAWTPWRGDAVPSHCDPNTTVPVLKSNLDGVDFGPAASGNASIVGWAWSPDAADGGRAPLNVSFTMDGKAIGWVLATVSRPGLVPKTGAPDPNHGFSWALPPAVAAAARVGDHTFAVSADVSGQWMDVQHSPTCTCDAAACPCKGQRSPPQLAVEGQEAAWVQWMTARGGD